MARLAAAVLIVLALTTPAQAARWSGSGAKLAAPGGLKAFVLHVNEASTQVFPRTPSFAWKPVRGAKRYQLVLATSPTFAGNAIVWDDSSYTGPAAAVPVTLPWITGNPYSLYARVRAISSTGNVGPWSSSFGFNMRWSAVPSQLTGGPGYVRWSTVDGATSYDVWFTNADMGGGISKIISTVTNVADEREYYAFHNADSWINTVKWRVRAVRRTQDTQGPTNGLPTVSYGPWSPVFTSTNPSFTQGALKLGNSISDTTSTPGAPTAHRIMPAFLFSGDEPLGGVTDCATTLAARCELFRVYVFSDDDCINVVYRGGVVGSPAYAPRITGPLLLPGDTKKLDAARLKNLSDGTEGKQNTADGAKITTIEAQPPATFVAKLIQTSTSSSGSGTGGSGTGSSSGSSTGSGSSSGSGSGSTGGTTTPAPGTFPSQLSGQGAPVDLWDTQWPTGRYYWTVVPVQYFVEVKPDTDPSAPTPANPPLVYFDLDVAQDACAAGRVSSFGKISEPTLTSSGAPYATGLSPQGKLVSAKTKRPVFASNPLVAWQPALGASAYEVQWSKKAYPWRPEGNLFTFSTSANLPLKPGNWSYRVRGIDLSLPGGSAQMTWSDKMSLVIAKPKFKVGK
jgi:uncharacterized membrane protein YgcG